DVAEGIAVAVSGYALSGSAAANYSLTQPAGFTADITPKALSVVGLAIDNKVYDGTVAAVIGGTATLDGAVTGDDVALDASGASAAFAAADVAEGIAVSVSDYGLSGSAAANYSLTQPAGFTADITPKALTLGGGFTVEDKLYDGTTHATIIENNLELVTPIAGDDVSLAQVVAEFTASEVSNDVDVLIVYAELSGEDISNYVLSLANSPRAVASISTLVGTEEHWTPTLTVYPNPFVDVIYIDSAEMVNSVRVTDAAGKQVLEAMLNGEQQLNTSHLSSGFYVLTLFLEEGRVVHKKMMK
ncbi:YDG domain-containing protein, partial [Geofilum rhodophaeum]|uniref:YDG domain-containing protein n=1 Tax=Geofilum rhodophaeum TaxID=1965019 RepID=UPI0011BAAAEE